MGLARTAVAVAVAAAVAGVLVRRKDPSYRIFPEVNQPHSFLVFAKIHERMRLRVSISCFTAQHVAWTVASRQQPHALACTGAARHVVAWSEN